MGELTATDVENFTGGRLTNDGGTGEVTRMLKAALMVARRDVGWHVSPLRTGHVVTLDGPCSRMLPLPTLYLVALTHVVEDSDVVDLNDLKWSVGRPPESDRGAAVVRKKSRGFWSGDYQAIEITMDHGYTEDEAEDWRQAILSMVDQMSLLPASKTNKRSDADLSTKKVDDVQYGWADTYTALAEQVLFSVESILSGYRLPEVYFV